MHKESNTYTTTYRNIRYPRLELKTGTLQLILPKHYKNPHELLGKHDRWIQRRQQEIQNAIQEAETLQLNHARTLPQLKTIVYTLTQQYETELHTKTNKTIYRKMKTKWASYSKNKNLTINTLTRYLPQNLIEYIIYHELTHAKERKHNSTFWTLLNKKHPNHQTLENHLLAHWFQIQKIKTHSDCKTKTSHTPRNRLRRTRSQEKQSSPSKTR